MGKATDAARAAGATVHADLIDNLKEQLLIVFLKRLGGRVSIPVEEVDDTGHDLFALNFFDGVFNFEIQKKS
jgi:hypothetical protein